MPRMRVSAWVIPVALVVVLAGCGPVPGEELDGGSPHPVPTAPPSSLPNPSDSSGGKVPVSPYIVFAEVDFDGTTVSASGAVDDLLESEGACDFVFTPASGDPVTLSSTGHPDATYTSCGSVTDSISLFPSGTWQVELHYESADASGTSASVTMEVP